MKKLLFLALPPVIFLVFSLIFYLLLFGSQLVFADMVVPPNRHFVFKSTTWNRITGKTPSHGIIRAEVTNTRSSPVTLEARALKMTVNEDGIVSETGSTFDVKPAKVTLYPKQHFAFEIFIPWMDVGGVVGAFRVTPETNQKVNSIVVRWTKSFIFGCSFVKGKWKPRPVLSVKQLNGMVSIGIDNTDPWVCEGTMILKRGDENVKSIHFFILPKQKRVSAYPCGSIDSVLVDIGGAKRISGWHIR